MLDNGDRVSSRVKESIYHGIFTVWPSNEIDGSIFHKIFLHRFVARTDLYLCWKNRSGTMKDNRDNVSTTVKPKHFTMGF
jgi:hypothetical protein